VSQPFDIPPVPPPSPTVTVPQALFERMAAVYWGSAGRPADVPVVDEPEEAPKVFDPERAGAIVFPDVHPGWRPVGRNAPKAPPRIGGTPNG